MAEIRIPNTLDEVEQMKATQAWAEEQFRHYNDLCFDGSLPQVPIVMNRARRCLGSLRYQRQRRLLGGPRFSDFRLCISTVYDLPEAEMEDTLIHEMIHLSILSRQLQDTSAHGPLFRQMMQDINTRFHRHVTISHRSTDTAYADQQRRVHYLCVSHLQDGRVGITLASHTRIFHLWRELPRSFPITSSQWYGTTDPFFNQYPRALKPKLYIIDPALLAEHLTDATPLECDGQVMRAKK